jgi:predicted metal-dependent hydrolase
VRRHSPPPIALLEVLGVKTKLDIQIIRSYRKTIAMKIDSPDCLVVRVPRAMPNPDIDAFIKKHWDWITRHLQLAQAWEAQKASIGKFSEEEIKDLADQALKIIPERVAFFAHHMGIRYGRITIRNQKTRWGSCSSKGNLNFNCLLMLVPPDVRDFVIVHELCHLREMNHSPRFWAEVAKVIPDYREHRKWLKDNQAGLIGRV